MNDVDTSSASEASPSVLDQLKAMPEDQQRALKGWYWYDFANQAFALTILAAVLPAYMAALFDAEFGGGLDTILGTISGSTYYSLVLAASSLVVALVSPPLGILADRLPIKKRLLGWFTVVGIGFTILMGISPFFGGVAGLRMLTVAFMFANFGFAAGNVFYYAFMPYLAPKAAMDHVSTWGYVYGYIGGVIIMIVHLGMIVGIGSEPWVFSVVFITSALWWLGFGIRMFFVVPEPEVPNPQEVDGFFGAIKLSIAEVGTTFRQILRFRVFFTFLIGYLLFFDGINTVNGIASAFLTSVMRINTTVTIALVLALNIVAIPFTILFGRISDRIGAKRTLIVVLVTYSMVAFTAAGFAPLVLEEMSDAVDGSSEAYLANQKEAYRYDLVLEWYDATTAGAIEDQRRYTNLWVDGYTPTEGTYVLSSLHGRPMISDGTNKWVAPVGDASFHEAFSPFYANGTVQVLAMDVDAASAMVANFTVTDHRFSIIVLGGPEHGARVVGEQHPTMLDQGGLMDWWPILLRNNLWEPLDFDVAGQAIMLGILVGVVIGSAGAQARTMATILIPKSRNNEFFAFFGFISKAAAFLGPLVYFAAGSIGDDRVAIVTVILVIVAGTIVTTFVDVEAGVEAADEEDARLGSEGFA